MQQGLPRIYITTHHRMQSYNGHLHAKCQVPVPLNREDERLGGYDLGLRTSDFSTYNKVVKNLKVVSCFITIIIKK